MQRGELDSFPGIYFRQCGLARGWWGGGGGDISMLGTSTENMGIIVCGQSSQRGPGLYQGEVVGAACCAYLLYMCGSW